MPVLFIAVLSCLVYGALGWLLWKRRWAATLFSWPADPGLRAVWLAWLGFLFVFGPLVYHHGDMPFWIRAVRNLLEGRPLPDAYVYLPIFAETLAALAYPFHLAGVISWLLVVFVIKWFVIVAYALAPGLMVRLLPRRDPIAPVAIALAPVTILYLFFGTNHVLMFVLFLAALLMVQKECWFWAGFLAACSCYKFQMAPTAIVLLLVILGHNGLRPAWTFCLGGLLSLLPSLAYYAFDPSVLLRVVQNQGAIGAHCAHIEPFHFFHGLTFAYPGFESWYLDGRVWLIASLAGAPIGLLLYRRRHLSLLQCLALSYATVTVFSLEPYRLEPMVGLLWLDAVHRRDVGLQAGIAIILFAHAAMWFDLAYPALLDLDASTPLRLWGARGLFLGIPIVLTWLTVFMQRNKGDDFILPHAV